MSSRHLANLVGIATDRGARRNAVRVQMFRLARRFTPLVGVDGDGVRFVVSTRERDGVGMFTFVGHGVFQEQTFGPLVSALAEYADVTLAGATVLEIGANIGTETVSMLARHGVGNVIAVEPDPDNVRLLRANLALNDFEGRAKVLAIALSDTDGTVTVEHSPDNFGDHRVRVANPGVLARANEDGRETIDVPARTLDGLFAEGVIDPATLDLVWMDAQGHEAHILGGAAALPSHVPVLTEYWPYGLARAGALERFHSLVADRYTRVVDLGSDGSPVRSFPAGEIAQLAPRYAPRDGSYTIYTDLLLLGSRA